MKGIDAAVATILLLMITVSLIGFVFVWFNSLARNMASQTQNSTQHQLYQSQMHVSILDLNSTTITIQNTGTVEIPSGDVVIFVPGHNPMQVSVALAPNQVVSIPVSCNSGDTVKITVAGHAADSALCP